jgi:hypothetical protein
MPPATGVHIPDEIPAAALPTPHWQGGFLSTAKRRFLRHPDRPVLDMALRVSVPAQRKSRLYKKDPRFPPGSFL